MTPEPFDWAAAKAAARLPHRACNVFPMRLVWNEAKGKNDKIFDIPKGADWHTYEAPADKMRKAKNWGITIPAGIVGVDLDLYEAGCSREAVEAFLGCKLEWDAALLQTTASGGHHYLFAIPDGVTIRQGAKIGGVPGFDLRTHGKGLLCGGKGYDTGTRWEDAATAMRSGVFPWLPAAAIEKLRKPDPAPIDTAMPAANDGGLPDWLPAALGYIDRDNRDTWLQVGMALHSTGEPDAWHMWCNWSKGSAKFDADDQRKTWDSMRDKSDGVTLGTLYQLAKDGGWPGPERGKRDIYKTARTPTPAYKLLTGADVQALPPLAWRVKGVLPARGLAQIYGPPASGKSFLAFDMAAAIAGGHDWYGYRVKQAPVVYIMLEGAAGAKQRTQAWCRTQGEPLPDGMRIVTQPLRIKDAGDVAALAQTITDAGLQGVVVVIDTQSASAPDADENSSADVGLILQGAKRLADLVDGVVVLIAHSGKDEGRGVRGHSSQRAAMDASIRVSRDGQAREWATDKAKDGTDGGRHGFRLEVVRVGTDADGDDITSCVVVRDDDAPRVEKLSGSEREAIKAYAEAVQLGLGEDGGLGLEAWRQVFYKRSTADTDTAKRQAFHRARKALQAHERATVADDVYQITDAALAAAGFNPFDVHKVWERDKRDCHVTVTPDTPGKP